MTRMLRAIKEELNLEDCRVGDPADAGEEGERVRSGSLAVPKNKGS